MACACRRALHRGDKPEDAELIDYCKALQADLAKQTALGEPVRALLDLKPAKAATKRWGWVKKGAPIIVEVGPRDMAGGNVSVVRRDRLYREDGKLDSAIVTLDAFIGEAAATLEDVQKQLFAQADERLRSNIAPVDDWATIETMFADSAARPGWADVAWSRPSGAELDKVVERLKALKLTIRNAPSGQTGHPGAACIFTGAPAVERVLVGRSY
jgi:prolyl-tRNA synthetase